MAEFTITDPTTGRTLTVRGDKAPTEQEAASLFASTPVSPGQRAPAERQTRIAALERELAGLRPTNIADVARAAGTVATSAIAEPLSGIAGLAGLIAGVVPGGESPSEKGTRFVEGAREALTLAPGTPQAEQIIEGVGILGESAAEVGQLAAGGIAGLFQLGTGQGVEQAAETIGRVREQGVGPTAGRALQDIGAPRAISAAAETLPIAAASLAGVRTPRLPGRGPEAPTPPPVRPTITPSEGPAVSVGRPSLDQPVDIAPQPIAPFQEPTVARQAAAAPVRTRADDFLDQLAPTLEGASNDTQAINLLRDQFPDEARRLGDLKTTGPEIREALADLRLGRRDAATVKAELVARINEQGPGQPGLPDIEVKPSFAQTQRSKFLDELDSGLDIPRFAGAPPSIVSNVSKGDASRLARAAETDPLINAAIEDIRNPSSRKFLNDKLIELNQAEGAAQAEFFATSPPQAPLGRDLSQPSTGRGGGGGAPPPIRLQEPTAPTPPAPTSTLAGVGSETPGATFGQPRAPVSIEAPAVPPARPAGSPAGVAAVDSAAIVDDLVKGRTEAAALKAAPDVATVESAQRLGVDLNPEHYATNLEFQSVARALKSESGSTLAANEVRAIQEVSAKADEVVTDLGGALDRGALSEDLVQNTRATIGDLQEKANLAYTEVRAAIPAQTRVQMDGIQAHLDAQLADLGGDAKLLTSAEKKLAGAVKRAGEEGLTYAALDRIRRDVGDGFNKNRGPFADNDVRVLREIYEVLSETQQGVAEAFGVGETYTAARGLVAKRKGVEDDAVSLFGRNLNNTLVQKFKTAAAGVAKGDVTALNRLMEPLSEARRAEVAATVLGDLFTGTSRGVGQATPAFGKTWEALNRSPTAKKALFRHLPEGAEKRFDDIGRVMLAIERSNRKPLANPSGSAAAIVNAINNGTVASRVITAGKRVIADVAGTAAGVGPIGTITRIVRGKQDAPSQAAAVDAFLASPEFNSGISRAIAGDVAEGNRIIQNSPRFKRWLAEGGLDESTLANIANTGFIGWVSGQEEQ